ncbi:TetR/AcrR family transcriptional regulator [Pseudomonas sp. BGr12]|uniref:TetR/AcrR family transcriptional regulator n=1 Tax=Pseudomonas sp. BGr12 TaxID=2936269 RepID=UPI002559C277|nr:TetR/AcrR family transcriptional regulator [Pseudomonas sp. BJa5]MDL2428420.1 TetR/AcrR family transcriptional regulator [Pseudomonas sp. BJa5]
MPKIVDHEQRKAEITKIVLKSIGKNGLANTTIRGISREGGFSSGTLAHYFSDKDELMNFAFNAVSKDTHERMRERAARYGKAIDKLRVVIEELTPNEDANLDSQISLAFWDAARLDSRLLGKFREVYEELRGHVRKFIGEGIESGELNSQLDVELEVDFIVALCDGFLVSFLLDPERFTAERRDHVISFALSRLER